MARLLLLLLIACGQKDPPLPAPTLAETRPADAAVPRADAPVASDPIDEIAKLVVHDVGTKALGSQTIDASCVAVLIMPAGRWTVASAHLNGCGDKTARSIVWLYKREGNGKWSEDYVGQPPKCWKAVPPDLKAAVAAATKIPSC